MKILEGFGIFPNKFVKRESPAALSGITHLYIYIHLFNVFFLFGDETDPVLMPAK